MSRIKQIAIMAAAAMAAMTGAPTSRLPFLPAASQFQGWAGGRRRGRGWSSKNDAARAAGIPKAFRQYARRYGSDVATLVQMHRRSPAPMLDHGRDRTVRAMTGVPA